MQDRGVGQKLADPGGSEVQVIILHEEQGSLGPARGGHGSLGKPLVRGAIALSPGGNHGRVDVGREGQGVHLVLEEPQQRVGDDSVVAVKHVLRQDLVAEAHVVVRKGALDQRSNEREGGRVIRGTVAARPRRIAQLLQDQFPALDIIASGGVSNMADIETLADMNLSGVIVGKAIYEGAFSVAEALDVLHT